MNTVTSIQEGTMMLVPRNVVQGIMPNIERFDKVERKNLSTGQVVKSEIRSGVFSGRRFPNTIVRERIPYDESKGCYACGKYTKPENQNELNEIVKEIGLTYQDGRYKGEVIETANPKNRKDPFFTNHNLKIIAEEGYYIFNPSKALDRLFIEAMKSSNKVSMDPSTQGGSNEIVYYLVPVDYEQKNKEQSAARKMHVFAKFSKLTDYQKAQICFILREDIDMFTSPEVIDTILFTKLDNPVKLSNNIDSAKEVEDLMDLPMEELVMRSYIVRALKNKIITMNNGLYYFNGNSLGKNTDQVYVFFSDFSNGDLYRQLQKDVNAEYFKENYTGKNTTVKERIKQFKFDFSNLEDNEG